MIKAGTGKSSAPEARKAGEEACREALAKIGGKADLVIVFSTVNYDQTEVLKGVKTESKNALLAGCSSIRGIVNGVGLDNAVVIMAVASDKITFQVGVGKRAKENSKGAGRMLAESLSSKEISVLMVFLEAVGVNGSAVVRGIQEGSRKNLPIIGGMASDASTFTKTYQYYEGQVLTDSVVGIGLSNGFAYGVGAQHGWESIGLPVKVTKSKGSVIQEINHKPAIKFFEGFFGEKAKQLEKPLSRICYVYPLGMNIKGSAELLIRNAFVATKKGEIVCAGEIPQGSEIRLMLGDKEKAIKAAKKAAECAKKQLKGARPKAIFVFDCAARYMLLGSQADEEIKAIQAVLGEEVPLVGFYTYGEQAPLRGVLGPECRSMFHNETMTLFVLAE